MTNKLCLDCKHNSYFVWRPTLEKTLYCDLYGGPYSIEDAREQCPDFKKGVKNDNRI